MDNYKDYEKYEDILFKSKGSKGSKGKQNKVSCYSSKHVRIQQSKVSSKNKNKK
jgi:hypothetical protein